MKDKGQHHTVYECEAKQSEQEAQNGCQHLLHPSKGAELQASE